MIQIRNNAVLTTALAMAESGAIVPFDTVVYNTNNRTNLSNNTVQITSVGYYDTKCTVILSNTGDAAATVTLTMYADGVAVTGAKVTTTIAAASTATLMLDFNTNILTATSGTANISWYVSGGAVNLTNAFASINRYC